MTLKIKLSKFSCKSRRFHNFSLIIITPPIRHEGLSLARKSTRWDAIISIFSSGRPLAIIYIGLFFSNLVQLLAPSVCALPMCAFCLPLCMSGGGFECQCCGRRRGYVEGGVLQCILKIYFPFTPFLPWLLLVAGGIAFCVLTCCPPRQANLGETKSDDRSERHTMQSSLDGATDYCCSSGNFFFFFFTACLEILFRVIS